MDPRSGARNSQALPRHSRPRTIITGAPILHEPPAARGSVAGNDRYELRTADPAQGGGILGLSNTYVFSSEHFDKYFTLSPIHSGSRVIRIPQALASSSADGAIISTPQDTLTFSRAFRNGEIFRDSWLPQLGLGPTRCEKSLRMGLGMMVAPARRGKSPIVGYSGIAGCAVGVDVDKGHHAFLTTFQWSSPTSSFAAVASLLQSTRA